MATDEKHSRAMREIEDVMDDLDTLLKDEGPEGTDRLPLAYRVRRDERRARGAPANVVRGLEDPAGHEVDPTIRRQMRGQDVRIVGVDRRVLDGAAEEVGRLAHEILVERVLERDEHGE